MIRWQKSNKITCCSWWWEVTVIRRQEPRNAAHVFKSHRGELGLQPRRSWENWMGVSKHKIIKNGESMS